MIKHKGLGRGLDALLPPGLPVLAIGPAANWRGKEWRAERFAELMRRLTMPDAPFAAARVAVLAAAHEREQAAPVLAALPSGRVIDLVGRTNLLTAASYIAAARLSKRIGLIRTMVYTHFPSNLCMILMPFAPSLAVASVLFATLSYDPVADFAPVSLVVQYPTVIVVPNSSPARTLQEFITHAKASVTIEKPRSFWITGTADAIFTRSI